MGGAAACPAFPTSIAAEANAPNVPPRNSRREQFEGSFMDARFQHTGAQQIAASWGTRSQGYRSPGMLSNQGIRQRTSQSDHTLCNPWLATRGRIRASGPGSPGHALELRHAAIQLIEERTGPSAA